MRREENARSLANGNKGGPREEDEAGARGTWGPTRGRIIPGLGVSLSYTRAHTHTLCVVYVESFVEHRCRTPFYPVHRSWDVPVIRSDFSSSVTRISRESRDRAIYLATAAIYLAASVLRASLHHQRKFFFFETSLPMYRLLLVSFAQHSQLYETVKSHVFS